MSPKLYVAPDERQLLSRFWRSASGFWLGGTAWVAWSMIAFLIATILLQLGVQYWLNFWNRDFFDAIERRNGPDLLAQTIIFAPLVAASVALAVVSVWGRMTMQRKWREWLSHHLYEYWLQNDRHRRLQFMAGEHQNPEYRIAEDARLATDLPIDLALGLFSALLTAITFIGILLSVGGAIRVSAFDMSVTVPGYLVIAVSLYSILLSSATMTIGRRLTQVIEDYKKAEADLRSVGAHLRESDTPSKGMTEERRVIHAALDQVIARWLALCWQLMRTTLVSHTNLLLTPFIALLLCTPKYVDGAMTLGEVVQASAAFVLVQGAFNWITDNYGRIAEWMSSANRVAYLLLALDQTDRLEPPSPDQREQAEAADGGAPSP